MHFIYLVQYPPFATHWFDTGPTSKILLYYKNCFQEKAAKTLSNLLDSEKKITISEIQTNSTLEMLKINQELFLLQSGYLTLGNFKSETENSLRFPNKEVESTLSNIIFQELQLSPKFTIEQFESFLNEMTEFFDIAETASKESLESYLNKILSTMRKFFEDAIKEYQEKTGKSFNDETFEKSLSNIFCLYLNNLKWKNWVSVYQGEILERIESNGSKKPDFLFVKPKEETEIYLEMLRSNWWGHLERNFHDNAKPHIKKIHSMSN